VREVRIGSYAGIRRGGLYVRFCEGFRMPAHDGAAMRSGAGVRKPPREMLWGGGVDIASIVRCEPMELPMQTLNNLSRSLIALEPASTLIAVIEMSLSSWLVAGIVPGIERRPLKKLAVDESALLRLLHRWREEAEKAGCRIERIVVAFEAG